jgi:hypothetical protein
MNNQFFRITFLAVLILCLSLAQCSKEKAVYIPDDLQKIFGTWDWISSSGGFGGGTTTALASGTQESIEFTKINKVKWVVNGNESKDAYFQFKAKDSFLISKANYYIEYSRLFLPALIYFDGDDTLHLDGYNCGCCVNEIYIRRK